ncbi:cytochrome b-c1 complex subunit 2, mitochondrial isoform X2 [Nematostella vectensis]|uniref:cytochrome b-c1 complex subunit 2, mitochondrial isoform X2 n=1 Tax=Nematostella vectensis TaxID=45351 RepID=UPI00138FCA44|nr:cytochrome b-c1 complex subunit 2, mitochondrial isoform X2 [Nematostella vectensis]
MLPLRRAGPSIAGVIRKAGPSTQKLYASTAVPLNEPLTDIPAKGSVRERQTVQVTTLDNGLKVASLETYSPISRVGLFFDAGSRYETDSNLGITHMLRNAAYLSTPNRTAFRIARDAEQHGASLEATCTRDHLFFASDCVRDSVGAIIDSLAEVTLNGAYSPWDLEEAGERIRLDLAIANTQPQIGVLEELHKIAFRKNLGNSIYCLPHRISRISTKELLDFKGKHFVGKRMALVGVGIDHAQLVDHAKASLSSLPSSGEAVTKDPAKYHGGESLIHKPTSLVHATLAVQGAGLGSKDLLALGILQRVMGSTPSVKWGSNMASSRLNKAASEVAQGPFAVSALNMSYSDSGLFGCYFIASPAEIEKVMKASLGQFAKVAKGEVSDDELLRAKNQLKASLLMNNESGQTNFEDIGAQVLTTGSYSPASDAATMVDAISKADLLAVAKRLMSSKPCLSAAGDVTNVPHVDELF